MCIDYKFNELVTQFPYQFNKRHSFPAQKLPVGWLNLYGLVCVSVDTILSNGHYVTDTEKRRIFKGWAQATEENGVLQLWYHDIDMNEDEELAERIFDVIQVAEQMSHMTCRICGYFSTDPAVPYERIARCANHAHQISIDDD